MGRVLAIGPDAAPRVAAPVVGVAIETRGLAASPVKRTLRPFPGAQEGRIGRPARGPRVTGVAPAATVTEDGLGPRRPFGTGPRLAPRPGAGDATRPGPGRAPCLGHTPAEVGAQGREAPGLEVAPETPGLVVATPFTGRLGQTVLRKVAVRPVVLVGGP